MVPVLGLLALSVALAAAAVYVGTRPRLPAPFGPARNGAIVFSSGGDIATGSLGAPAEFIVRGPEVDFEPFYSPNGTRIAFYRQFGKTPGAATDITVMNPDGTGLTRITATPLLEIPWSASWTPDGNRIVVQTNERLDGRLLSFDAAGDGPPVAIDQAAASTTSGSIPSRSSRRTAGGSCSRVRAGRSPVCSRWTRTGPT